MHDEALLLCNGLLLLSKLLPKPVENRRRRFVEKSHRPVERGLIAVLNRTRPEPPSINYHDTFFARYLPCTSIPVL